MTVATGRWLVVLHGSTTEEPRLPKISPVIDRDGGDNYDDGDVDDEGDNDDDDYKDQQQWGW